MQLVRVTLPAIAATLLLASAEAPTHSNYARKLGKPQKIERFGYSIRIIERWSSVPQKPGVTPVVGSWQPDQEDINLRGDWSAHGCELKIVRFKTPGALTGSKEEIDKEKEKREKEKREHQRAQELSKIRRSFNARTLDEYMEMEYEGARDRSRPQTVKAGRSPRKLKGELLEFTKGSNFVLAALFKERDWSWGVIYEAHEDYYKKEWADLYKKSLRS